MEQDDHKDRADDATSPRAHGARRWFGKYAWLNFPDGVDAFLEAEAAKVSDSSSSSKSSTSASRAAA